MTDQNTNTQDNSYVDNYQPPVAPAVVGPSPTVANPVPPVAQVVADDKPTLPTPPTPAPVVDDQPVAKVGDEVSVQPVTQSLEEQNIFVLLGVENSKDEEKESFLDELQQVIWEDFLENDVRLLITQEEYIEFEKIVDNLEQNDEEKQEELLVYLEKLIPDIEEIMMEKAIELKAEMFHERILGLKEFYADKPEALEKLSKAEEQMKAEEWHSAAETLNTLK